MARVIGVDLDDVLVDFNTGLCAFVNARHGTRFTRDDVVSYHLERVWGCTGEEAIRRVAEFYHSPEHAALGPVEGAAEVITALEDAGDEVVVITSRPESVNDITVALLERHYPSLLGRVHFTSHFFHAESVTTKGEVCRELGVDAFVEDAYFHAEDAATAVRQVLLFDTPWNREYVPRARNIQRVHGWREAHNVLREGAQAR